MAKITYGQVQNVLAQLALAATAGQPNVERTGLGALVQGAQDQAQSTLYSEYQKKLQKEQEGKKGFLGDYGFILDILSFIPGPQQPFIMGANALAHGAEAVQTGNVLEGLGAVAGGIGAAGGFAANAGAKASLAATTSGAMEATPATIAAAAKAGSTLQSVGKVAKVLSPMLNTAASNLPPKMKAAPAAPAGLNPQLAAQAAGQFEQGQMQQAEMAQRNAQFRATQALQQQELGLRGEELKGTQAYQQASLANQGLGLQNDAARIQQAADEAVATAEYRKNVLDLEKEKLPTPEERAAALAKTVAETDESGARAGLYTSEAGYYDANKNQPSPADKAAAEAAAKDRERELTVSNEYNEASKKYYADRQADGKPVDPDAYPLINEPYFSPKHKDYRIAQYDPKVGSVVTQPAKIGEGADMEALYNLDKDALFEAVDLSEALAGKATNIPDLNTFIQRDAKQMLDAAVADYAANKNSTNTATQKFVQLLGADKMHELAKAQGKENSPQKEAVNKAVIAAALLRRRTTGSSAAPSKTSGANANTASNPFGISVGGVSMSDIPVVSYQGVPTPEQPVSRFGQPQVSPDLQAVYDGISALLEPLAY